MKLTKQKKGFTLIELLVGMAIIAVLLGLAAFGISIVQKSARDTARISKLKDIEIAIIDLIVEGQELPGHFKYGDVSADHITIGSTKVNFEGATKRGLVDADLGQSETNESVTDYCYHNQSGIYVIGVKLESGSYAYTTNNIGTYSSSTPFYTDPVGGTSLRCIDGNL